MQRLAPAIAVFSGLLAALAFPLTGLYPLAFIALSPFFWTLAVDHRASRRLGLGFYWGIAFFTPLLYWIPGVMIRFGRLDAWLAYLAFTLLVAVLSLFPLLFAGLFHLAVHASSRGVWILLPCLWTAVEWLRSHGPAGGFPWGQIGYALVPRLELLQASAWTGIGGITFLVVLLNSCLMVGILSARRTSYWWSAAAGTLGAAWLAGWGIFQAADFPSGAQEEIKIAVVQGNVAYEDNLEPARALFYQYYMPQTKRAIEEGMDIVVWPESPTPFSYSTDADYRAFLEQLIHGSHARLIFNDISRQALGKTTAYFNSALFLDASRGLVGRYDKVQLVPFGEYLPFSDWLGWGDALTREVGSFKPGREAAVVRLAGRGVGGFICYEAIFPHWIRRFTDNGAEWLVNLTNDAWYGDTSAPHQHLQMAVVRAIENRRHMVRAANSGISAFIDPLGRVTARLGLFERGLLTGRVEPRKEISFYVRYGDILPAGCAIISLGWILFGIRQKFNNKRLSGS